MAGFDFNVYQREERAKMTGKYSATTPIPQIVCADGFAMSVQASEYTYCSPRESGEPFYSAVEVGFPSAREESLMEYAEDAENPTGTVYGWVPVGIVNAIVDAHGGPRV